MCERTFGPAVEFGDLFRCKLVVEFFAEVLKDFALFFKRKPVHLLQNLCCTHGVKLRRRFQEFKPVKAMESRWDSQTSRARRPFILNLLRSEWDRRQMKTPLPGPLPAPSSQGEGEANWEVIETIRQFVAYPSILQYFCKQALGIEHRC